MNFALVIINLYDVKKLLKGSKHDHFIESLPDDAFIRFFLESHMADIHQYFPGYATSKN